MDISEDRVVLDNTNTYTQTLQTTEQTPTPLCFRKRARDFLPLLQTTSTTNCTTLTTYCVFFSNKKNQFVFL